MTFLLKQQSATGRIWAKGVQFVPVEDRSHQLNVYRDIERHAEQEAAVIRFIDRADRHPEETVDR